MPLVLLLAVCLWPEVYSEEHGSEPLLPMALHSPRLRSEGSWLVSREHGSSPTLKGLSLVCRGRLRRGLCCFRCGVHCLWY